MHSLKYFLTAIAEPKGYIYEGEITPFPLQGKKTLRETETYHEAIDTLKLSEKPSPYLNKIKTLQRTIAEQEEAIKNQEENIAVNFRKGELVYEKYAPAAEDAGDRERDEKSRSWEEIAKELKKEKKILSVNLEKKAVVINL